MPYIEEPGPSIVKWESVAHDRIDHVSRRLSRIADHRLAGIPKLLEFGLTPDLRIRLRHERVPGSPLSKLMPLLSSLDCQLVSRTLQCFRQEWAKHAFIHGDLSPRNILIESTDQRLVGRIWCIDWLLDLETRRGTPLYAAPEVFEGIRSLRSDEYSISRILCILGASKNACKMTTHPAGTENPMVFTKSGI